MIFVQNLISEIECWKQVKVKIWMKVKNWQCVYKLFFFGKFREKRNFEKRSEKKNIF